MINTLHKAVIPKVPYASESLTRDFYCVNEMFFEHMAWYPFLNSGEINKLVYKIPWSSVLIDLQRLRSTHINQS